MDAHTHTHRVHTQHRVQAHMHRSNTQHAHRVLSASPAIKIYICIQVKLNVEREAVQNGSPHTCAIHTNCTHATEYRHTCTVVTRSTRTAVSITHRKDICVQVELSVEREAVQTGSQLGAVKRQHLCSSRSCIVSLSLFFPSFFIFEAEMGNSTA